MSNPIDALVAKYPDLEPCSSALEKSVEGIADSYRQGGQLLICGNGGSSSDSEHIVGELLKEFERSRPVSEELRAELETRYSEAGKDLADDLQGALPTISLVSQTSFLTAFANDVDANVAFAQQVYAYGGENDALLGISTSGNSENVVNACRVANALGMTTVGLTGKGGGRMAGLCDITIEVPETGVADIQERHLPIYHALCRGLEAEFFA